jgi:hypothetical protein
MLKSWVSWSLSVMLALSLVSCSGGTQSDTTSESSPPPSAASDLRQKAKDAYVFAFPLVMYYRTMYRQAIEGDRRFGEWMHLGTSSPQDKDINTPNNDTPYSYAWVDLRAEPWVLTLPQIEPDRYYTSQWNDQWGFILDNIGSVNDGNNGVSVLLADPQWNGAIPPGVSRVVKGESEFMGSITRTQLKGTDDGIGRVQEIQRGYQLQPLSAFLKTPAPAAAPEVQWPAWTEGAEMTPKFWDYFTFLLPFTTDNPVDKPMHDKLAELGIKRGEPFDQQSLSQEVREALAGGIEDGQAEMKKVGSGDVDSAKIFGDRARLGTDYLDRAMGAYVGIFGDVAEQALYFPLPADSSGAPLDGSKASYTLTFPPGGQPPVKFFWSITMYRLPDRYLVDNPINRYSIGSSTPGVKPNPDGSLMLYFSPTDPGGEKTSNWLPAPNGPFWMVMRTYGPQPPILDGSWQPPKIEKQS